MTKKFATKKFEHSYFEKVSAYFGNDLHKVWDWLQKDNEKLNGKSPMECIRIGKSDKVKKLIDEALDGQ